MYVCMYVCMYAQRRRCSCKFINRRIGSCLILELAKPYVSVSLRVCARCKKMLQQLSDPAWALAQPCGKSIRDSSSLTVFKKAKLFMFLATYVAKYI
jgi:hypothetical protein